MAVGDSVTDQFVYTATDGQFSPQANLTVTVTGSDQGDNGENVFLLTGSGHSATGKGGNDTYTVDGSDDHVTEAANGGTDTVKSTAATYTLEANVERLVLAGRGDIDGTGNALANIVKGNTGDNVLDAKDGRDTLIGFGGHDTFVFSTALAKSNIDHVTDFDASDDLIGLDTSVFAALTFENDGTLAAGEFKDISVPGTKYGKDTHILYNSNKEALYYDADGYGGAGAVQFAALDGPPKALTAMNFVQHDVV